MKFILIEGLVRDIKKYYADIPETTFQLLVACDPTNKNTDKDFDSWVAGKYVKWILQKYQKGWFRDTDEQTLTFFYDTLFEFDKYKQHMPSQDINFYKSLDDLLDAIEKAKELEHRYIPSDKASMRAEKGVVGKDKAEVIYKNDSFTIYYPSTYPQAREVGAGSSWCTSANSSSFTNYSSDGPLRTIHLNGKPFAQYHFPSGQFLDLNDKKLDWTYFFRSAPIKDVKGVRDFMLSDWDSQKDSIQISSESRQLKRFIDEFPSDKELEDMETIGGQLADKLRPELTLIVDEFSTQAFIDWAFEAMKEHGSSIRIWQFFAKRYCSQELTEYHNFDLYMSYDPDVIDNKLGDGCFNLSKDISGPAPSLSAKEIEEFNRKLKENILHVLFDIFPVAPYLMKINYNELKSPVEAIYWGRDTRNSSYIFPTSVKRIYIWDDNELFDSIPNNLLRNKKYRFIGVNDYEEAVEKELAYQTKIANEQQGIHESLEERLSDIRYLIDRSKRLNNPEIFKQLNKGDFLYNTINNSFFYVLDVNGDTVKTIPAGSDLTLYLDQRPTLQTQSSLRNYFLLGNKAELTEIESDLVDTFNYDNFHSGLSYDDDDSMRKWQKSNGYYTYQDRALDDSGEEVDSDSTDVFVKNDKVEVNLKNGKTIYGELISSQWALDFGEPLRLRPMNSNRWDKTLTEINPEDIDNVHIIKFNHEPGMYSNVNLQRYRSGLGDEVLQLEGYIFKDKDSDGIKFYFPDVPSLGKNIGVLSDINEFEDALKATLTNEYGFKDLSFKLNIDVGNDIISRRNNQVVKEFTVELIPEDYSPDTDVSIDDLMEYISSSDYASDYYKKLLIKVLPSNIVTTNKSNTLCAKLNFVRRYTFANTEELDDYITTLLPEWMRGIDLFSSKYSYIRRPETIDDDQEFRNGMATYDDITVSGDSALEIFNEYLKRYHGRFSFQIVLGRNSKQRKQIIKKLFEAYPEIEEKLYNHILNN